VLAVLACAAGARGGTVGPVRLWSGAAPGETGTIGAEHDVTTERDRVAAGRRITRISNVTVPTLTVYLPPKDRQTGAAVLVFPGGSYRYVAIDIEGTEICEWLNSIGVTGVLVKYRTPPREGRPRYAAAFEDAQRAMGIVRARAAEWGIDPKRVGVIGFSAGAHLAALLSTQALDDASSRPDFAMVMYPGGVAQPGSERLAEEFRTAENAPPTFLVQTEDDSVRVENSLAYYGLLKAAKVPVEMHLYPKGGHGYGVRPTGEAVSTWPARAEEWMHGLGVLR
jgi:acetyl esterase/lipase